MTSAAKLLRWYKQHGRNLPWRRTRDPYRILVSEIMLQQTQVERVIAFYRAWLRTFPTWKRLRLASNEEVIRLWSGLGYNRRALMLRDIAVQVSELGVPQTEEDWQSLKGIGPYTAAAISAFAQKKRTMPIDTNIRRVLGRLLLGKPYPQPKIDTEILDHVELFLPKIGAYYDVPQAIFDLATSICTKVPDCRRCPLRIECKASKQFLSGNVRIPKQMVQKPIEQRHRTKQYPDRIYRGRILAIVTKKMKTSFKEIGSLIDPTFDFALDQEWIERMIERMKQDGLVRTNKKTISL